MQANRIRTWETTHVEYWACRTTQIYQSAILSQARIWKKLFLKESNPTASARANVRNHVCNIVILCIVGRKFMSLSLWRDTLFSTELPSLDWREFKGVQFQLTEFEFNLQTGRDIQNLTARGTVGTAPFRGKCGLWTRLLSFP